MKLIADHISKMFFRDTAGSNYFYAVSPLSLELSPGTVTVLMGRSGSGKTTLLNMLSGLLAPTEGKVFLDDTDLYRLNDTELSRLRNGKIGVIPQARSAVDTLTVMENILLPAALYGKQKAADEARRWMDTFEIAHLANAMPRELSGGELRRMAIIRAIMQHPVFLFADEPTGDLDDESTEKVLSTLQACAHEQEMAVLMVTHENEAIKYADRLLKMEQGQLTIQHDICIQ